MKTLANATLAVISVCLMAGMGLYIALAAVSGVQEQAARCSYEELAESACPPLKPPPQGHEKAPVNRRGFLVQGLSGQPASIWFTICWTAT